MNNRQKIIAGIVGVCLVIALLLGSKIFETVKKGTYQIKQAAVSGKMSAKMTPGLWLQFFGDIQTWPTADTYFFTSDKEGGRGDQSIEIRFNDGSLARISGTLRVAFPTSEELALALILKHGYKSYHDLESKLILPHLRNCLRLTANLMSARESYSEKRADFISYVWDQVQDGIYITEEEQRKVTDVLSGEEVTRTFKKPKVKENGEFEREKNPFNGLGLVISNFEVKEFIYSSKVKTQIETQQEAIMGIATATAKARKAEQEKITKEAEGKANVMEAKYEKEKEKVKAVVDARKEKEVAELAAQKELEVAKLAKLAAEQTKQQEILLGEGESTRKRLNMSADGALEKKLDKWEKVNARYADAIATYKGNWVPTVVMGSKEGDVGGYNGAHQLIEMLTAKTAMDLSLEMSVPRGGLNEAGVPKLDQHPEAKRVGSSQEGINHRVGH